MEDGRKEAQRWKPEGERGILRSFIFLRRFLKLFLVPRQFLHSRYAVNEEMSQIRCVSTEKFVDGRRKLEGGRGILRLFIFLRRSGIFEIILGTAMISSFTLRDERRNVIKKVRSTGNICKKREHKKTEVQSTVTYKNHNKTLFQKLTLVQNLNYIIRPYYLIFIHSCLAKNDSKKFQQKTKRVNLI